MWPWLVLAGAAYWLYEKKFKKPAVTVAPSSQPVERRQPKMSVFNDPEPAPQDAGSGGSGGSSYVSDGPAPSPPAQSPSASMPAVSNLTDFAKTVTPQSVTFAPRPTVATPTIEPQKTVSGSSIQAPAPVLSSPIVMTNLRTAKKTF